jgi:hypothetical protein
METEQNQVSNESIENRPNISLRDLVLMVQIIQECTKRGAWTAEELSSIGGFYDRLSAFLTSAGVNIKNLNSNLKE